MERLRIAVCHRPTPLSLPHGSRSRLLQRPAAMALSAMREVLTLEAPPAEAAGAPWRAPPDAEAVDALPYIDGDYGDPAVKREVDCLIEEEMRRAHRKPADFLRDAAGVTKGLVAEQLLSAMQKKGIRADFVLFVGDDRWDEDMFEVIKDVATGTELSPVAEVFACTVGQKPSKAKYYLEDTAEIIRMLQGLADASDLTMVH